MGTVLLDDYNRASLGTLAPNGQPYDITGAGWQIDGGTHLRPTLGVSYLTFETFRSDVEVTMALGGPLAAFDTIIMVRYEPGVGFVGLFASSTGSLSVAVVTGITFDVLHTWPGAAAGLGAGDTITLAADGSTYTAKVNGATVGTTTDPDARYRTASAHGMHEYLAAPASDWTNITSLSVAFDYTDHLAVVSPPPVDPYSAPPGHLVVTAGSPVKGRLLWDFFDRPAIGTAPPTGQTYTGVADWETDAGQLHALGGGDNQLTADVGATDVDISLQLQSSADNIGILARWTNVNNFVALAVAPSTGELILYRRSGGGFASIHTWGGVIVSTVVGKTLRLRIVGNTFAAYYNGALIGTATDSFNAGATSVGVWAFHSAARFDLLTVDAVNIPTPAAHLAIRGTAPDYPATTAAAHLVVYAGTPSFPSAEPPRTFALAGAIRGPVAYGPRVTRPGEYVPPIVAKVFRLRDPHRPVVTLDQSFERTWQDQFNGAGTGSLKLMNDDPDLALVRDGDVVRFELNGQAAFSWVVADREKVTIAEGEEHDEVTTLSGPGLLAWLTSSMLIYPARIPAPQTSVPAREQAIQGEPIEEDRVFSWSSPSGSLVDNDLYGFASDAGPMPDATEDGWPAEFVGTALIWAPTTQAGSCYFRNGFETDATEVEGYVYCQDPMRVWFDGVLVVESNGTEDAGTVQSFYMPITPYGTDSHVIAVAIDHQEPRPAGFALCLYTMDDEGNVASPLLVSDTAWNMIGYPPEPPQVTAGAVVQEVLAEMNSRRFNPQMSQIVWTHEVDSDGNPWPFLPEVTTKVGTDVFTFLQEMEPFVEFHMGWNPFELWLWAKDHRDDERNAALHGATEPDDPWSGNLRGLTHRRVT